MAQALILTLGRKKNILKRIGTGCDIKRMEALQEKKKKSMFILEPSLSKMMVSIHSVYLVDLMAEHLRRQS